jgi:hypothetical protein
MVDVLVDSIRLAEHLDAGFGKLQLVVDFAESY